MAQPVLRYERNVWPSRALAAGGVLIPIRLLIALPHLFVSSALMTLGHLASFAGYWVVAVTGRYPPAIHSFVATAIRWGARTSAWALAVTDDYPPFEVDPIFSVDVDLPYPEKPDRRWAMAGALIVPKTLALVPHAVAAAALMAAAFAASWAGQLAALFTGRLPAAINDFVAGAIQWTVRSLAWSSGLIDEYPPFRLEAEPSRGAGGETAREAPAEG
jgi:hypothetical protein